MIHHPALPRPLAWHPEPAAWTATADGLTADAAALTDLFADPFGEASAANAPRLLLDADADFTLSARVAVEFRGTFDAGALVVYQDDDHWGKVCLELSPWGEATVVSVVTRGVSDDCNHEPAGRDGVHLRVSRAGPVFAFHSSADGRAWRLARLFTLPDRPTRAGFLVQAPRGPGCRASFARVKYEPVRLADVRSGE